MKNHVISLKSFGYEKEDEIDFSNFKTKINQGLNDFDYLFLIRTEEEYDEEKDELKVCYHYYLYPVDYIKITEEKPFSNRTSMSGYRWIFKGFKDYYFKSNPDTLDSFKICYPYVS